MLKKMKTKKVGLEEMRKIKKRQKKKTAFGRKKSFSNLDKKELAFVQACVAIKRTINQFHA